MGDRSGNIGRYIAGAFGIAMLIAGFASCVLAAQTAPTEPHHGSALDGLDGFATLAALLAGAIALVLLVIGGLLLRTALRAPTSPRPRGPVPLPRARARELPPQR